MKALGCAAESSFARARPFLISIAPIAAIAAAASVSPWIGACDTRPVSPLPDDDDASTTGDADVPPPPPPVELGRHAVEVMETRKIGGPTFVYRHVLRFTQR